MHVTIKWKKMFHSTKNCWDKAQIMQDFRITPYINNIMHTAIVQRKQKAVCKRTAKFIDKLKPCKYSLTNRELKKQIFSNLEHKNQIARATEIPLRVIIFPAITRYHYIRIFAFQRYSHSFPNNQTWILSTF